jgi:hypothetical protein
VAPDREPKCSFCGKSYRLVAKIVAGPGVWICNECIALCNEIMIEELGSDRERIEVSCAGADVMARAASALTPIDPALAAEIRALVRSRDRGDPG